MTISKKCPSPHREGKGHNWIVWGTKALRLDAPFKPPLYRRCNYCQTTDTETKCCEGHVRDPGRWPSFHNCQRIATAERDGHWWCKTHDPVAIQEKRKTQSEKWKAESEADMARWRRELAERAAFPKMLAILQDLSDWAVANGDLVASDEWLDSIVRSGAAATKPLLSKEDNP